MLGNQIKVRAKVKNKFMSIGDEGLVTSILYDEDVKIVTAFGIVVSKDRFDKGDYNLNEYSAIRWVGEDADDIGTTKESKCKGYVYIKTSHPVYRKKGTFKRCLIEINNHKILSDYFSSRSLDELFDKI